MGCMFSRANADKKPAPYDFYRNFPLRYMGYAGHLGSACGPLLPPSIAYVPQMAATVYICSDVFQRTIDSAQRGDTQSRVVVNAFDALIWQLLASVVIPGFVFNGIRSTTRQLFLKQTKGSPCGAKSAAMPRSPLFARFLPCALALLATPFIIGPIDKGVDYVMNTTYRKWTEPCPEDLLDPQERLRLEKLKAQKAAKDAERLAKEKAKEAERLAREKAKQAEKAEKERLENMKRLEKEAKEKAREKCKQEEKAIREKLAAEEKALQEKMKKDEAEFKEKQAKLAKEIKDKSNVKMECD